MLASGGLLVFHIRVGALVCLFVVAVVLHASVPTPDSRERDSLERDWGRRIPAIRHPRALVPPPHARQSNGESWWRLALEQHTGEVGAFSQTISWEALCKYGLAAYFLEVLGDEGRNRPLVVSKSTGLDMIVCTNKVRGDNRELS